MLTAKELERRPQGNTHVITAINKNTNNREKLSMESTQINCLQSLDLYKKKFKEDYTLFKIMSVEHFDCKHRSKPQQHQKQ